VGRILQDKFPIRRGNQNELKNLIVEDGRLESGASSNVHGAEKIRLQPG